MNASLTRIEHDIEETRTRLYDTIDRIQDRLTVPGIVDEVMGSSGVPRFDGAFEQALGIVRRNPVPVLILAAGIGWLLHRMGRDRAVARLKLVDGTASDMPASDDSDPLFQPADRPPSISLIETGRVNPHA